MVHIKDPLLLIGKSSPCGGSGFPLSLSEWSFTIYYFNLVLLGVGFFFFFFFFLGWGGGSR